MYRRSYEHDAVRCLTAGRTLFQWFYYFDETPKTIMLGVKPESISHFTAVSSQVMKEMAQSANRVVKTQVSLAISGFTGPRGKDCTPVGTIWFARAFGTERVFAELKKFDGDCEAVIHQAALFSVILSAA